MIYIHKIRAKDSDTINKELLLAAIYSVAVLPQRRLMHLATLSSSSALSR